MIYPFECDALAAPCAAHDSKAEHGQRSGRSSRLRTRAGQRGLTLVEVMVALLLLTTFMVGFLAAFSHSRKVTENSVMHAASTSIVYGVIEQIKQLDYANMLPSPVTDPGDRDGTTPPLVRVRINQNTIKWLRVVYTAAPGTPLGPTVTPDPSAPAASVGGGAIDNIIGALPLSTVDGTGSQSINLNLWIWIDEVPDVTRDVTEVKKITLVYTYTYQAGGSFRTIRNREVFLRTRYDQ
jgi:prepilin-type N-terminal cleavage/methylation domain-containing protein